MILKEAPDLVEVSSIEEAQGIADEDFEVIEGERVESKEPIGAVVGQDLEAGETVRRGSTIYVDISDGISIPDLAGQTEDEAEQSIGEDFEIDAESEEVSDKPKGTILSQDPIPDGRTQRGSTIAVVVSAGQPPNPAFDPLLPTLQEMTAAPIMLPATLPPELKNVVIGDDQRGTDRYTTSESRYTILFLSLGGYPPPDPTQIVQPFVHAYTRGTLIAAPASYPPEPDYGPPVRDLGEVALPDGTIATLQRFRGGMNRQYVVGTFEAGGVRYKVDMEGDTYDGTLTQQVLSTMVKVPGT